MKFMLNCISKNAASFTTLLSAGQQHKMTPNAIGRSMGMAAINQLSVDCPEAMGLVMRTSAAQKELGNKKDNLNNITEEEKAVLQPMADSVCARFAAEDARQPLKQRTAQERTQVMTTQVQTIMLQNINILSTVYSIKQLSQQSSMEAVGIKMASLMMTQCPTYLILMGLDAKGSKH